MTRRVNQALHPLLVDKLVLTLLRLAKVKEWMRDEHCRDDAGFLKSAESNLSFPATCMVTKGTGAS